MDIEDIEPISEIKKANERPLQQDISKNLGNWKTTCTTKQSDLHGGVLKYILNHFSNV